MNRQNVSTTAALRLRQDYFQIMKDPVPYITAEPVPSNILEWHYVIRGPEKSLYEGGYYHGKLVFPKEFPFKPPKIIMITPNGRFKTDTRLCLSMSDFHRDTWNPAWSVSTILTGLLSFMLEQTRTMGSTETSEFEKREYAAKSLEFNIKDKTFTELFPGICDEINKKLEAASENKLKQCDSQSNGAQDPNGACKVENVAENDHSLSSLEESDNSGLEDLLE